MRKRRKALKFKVGDQVWVEWEGRTSLDRVEVIDEDCGVGLHYDLAKLGWMYEKCMRAVGPDHESSTAPDRSYYDWIPGVRCRDVAKHFPFNLGCALNYIWRAGRKSPDAVADLRKARDFIDYQIEHLEGGTQEAGK